MASQTDIANWASLKLGAGRINNINTEESEVARVFRSIYTLVLKSLLQNFPWNFCLKRDVLSPETAAPAWGYAYQYILPTDYLMMREIENNPDYIVEGGKILTDEGPTLYIRYHRMITDEALMPPLFVEMFATRLAYESCERVTQSTTKKESLAKEFDFILNDAYRSDSIEGSMEALEESTWLEARV